MDGRVYVHLPCIVLRSFALNLRIVPVREDVRGRPPEFYISRIGMGDRFGLGLCGEVCADVREGGRADVAHRGSRELLIAGGGVALLRPTALPVLGLALLVRAYIELARNTLLLIQRFSLERVLLVEMMPLGGGEGPQRVGTGAVEVTLHVDVDISDADGAHGIILPARPNAAADCRAGRCLGQK